MSTIDTTEPGKYWPVDDEPSRRFPIYTRGNTGEVYPNVITPLCGSIVTKPIAEGQRQVFLEVGAAVPADLAETDCAVLTGCFGGYLYANLSIARLMGARSPGMKPGDVDSQMFGISDAPPYRRQPGDRNIAASARIAKLMIRVLRSPDFDWLREERKSVADWSASRPTPAQATEEELLQTMREGAVRFSPLMRSLLLASMYGGVAAALVDRLAGKSDQLTRAQVSVGVGGVESAEPAVALWHLAQLVNESPVLSAAFDGGVGISQRVDDLGVDTDGFSSAFASFISKFGARGPDEWELASDTWGTDPEIALAAIERLRGSTNPPPSATGARLADERSAAVADAIRSVPLPARGVFRRASATLADGAAGREFAKGTIIEAGYAIRLALFELVRRAQERGGPSDRRDCWLVTADELPLFLARPADFADRIAQRREQREYLQERVPPFVFDGVIPPPSTWVRRDHRDSLEPLTAGHRLTGIAVSPGIASGPARVVTDPSDPSALEPGDVLVAPITDPAWTPLFLVASAVVVDVGANLSHAAIVARELGIPAVVSVDKATSRIADGTMVEVDGAAGTVTAL